MSSLAEYFPKGDTLIVVDEPVRLKEHSDMTFYEYSESMKNRLESGYVYQVRHICLWIWRQPFFQ